MSDEVLKGYRLRKGNRHRLIESVLGRPAVSVLDREGRVVVVVIRSGSSPLPVELAMAASESSEAFGS